MFYCEVCRRDAVGREQADFEFTLNTSYGPCEVCREVRECVDK